MVLFQETLQVLMERVVLLQELVLMEFVVELGVEMLQIQTVLYLELGMDQMETVAK